MKYQIKIVSAVENYYSGNGIQENFPYIFQSYVSL